MLYPLRSATTKDLTTESSSQHNHSPQIILQADDTNNTGALEVLSLLENGSEILRLYLGDLALVLSSYKQQCLSSGVNWTIKDAPLRILYKAEAFSMAILYSIVVGPVQNAVQFRFNCIEHFDAVLTVLQQVVDGDFISASNDHRPSTGSTQAAKANQGAASRGVTAPGKQPMSRRMAPKPTRTASTTVKTTNSPFTVPSAQDLRTITNSTIARGHSFSTGNGPSASNNRPILALGPNTAPNSMLPPTRASIADRPQSGIGRTAHPSFKQAPLRASTTIPDQRHAPQLSSTIKADSSSDRLSFHTAIEALSSQVQPPSDDIPPRRELPFVPRLGSSRPVTASSNRANDIIEETQYEQRRPVTQGSNTSFNRVPVSVISPMTVPASRPRPASAMRTIAPGNQLAQQFLAGSNLMSNLDKYASMPIEQRQAMLSSVIVECVESNAFFDLCLDLENNYNRLGLSLKWKERE